MNNNQNRSPHRPPHIYLDNAYYFVSCSTINKEKYFNNDAKKELLKDILKEKVKKFGVNLIAWVILDDHYHVLFKAPTRKTLTAFIGQINGRSSHDINTLDGAKGRAIWYNYWDKCPRSELDLYSFFNYIHVNPIKHGKVDISSDVICIQGEKWELREDKMLDFHKVLASYQYSSYPFYLRKYGESGLTYIWMDYPILVNIAGDL